MPGRPASDASVTSRWARPAASSVLSNAAPRRRTWPAPAVSFRKLPPRRRTWHPASDADVTSGCLGARQVTQASPPGPPGPPLASDASVTARWARPPTSSAHAAPGGPGIRPVTRSSLPNCLGARPADDSHWEWPRPCAWLVSLSDYIGLSTLCRTGHFSGSLLGVSRRPAPGQAVTTPLGVAPPAGGSHWECPDVLHLGRQAPPHWAWHPPADDSHWECPLRLPRMWGLRRVQPIRGLLWPMSPPAVSGWGS